MFRLMTTLGAVATVITLATACSSHWSATTSSGRVGLSITADRAALYDVTLTLEADEEPIACDALSWRLSLEFADRSAGALTHELYVGDAEEPFEAGEIALGEDSTFEVAGFGPWTATEDGGCRADATLALATAHAARGSFVVRADAEDESAGSEDDPKGEPVFSVSVAAVE